jgi:hypothetical protein
MNRRRTLCTALGRWRDVLLWLLLLGMLAPLALAAEKDEAPKTQGKAEGSAAAAAMPDTWYVSTMSKTDRGVMGVHYWSKGPFFRAETIVDGHRIATIIKAEHYYIIDVVSGTGVVIERSAKAVSEDADRGRPFGREWEELMRDGGEMVRSQEIAGVEYDLFRSSSRAGRREVLVTRSEPRIPIRVETFDRKTGENNAVRYLNWRRGIGIADGFFDPPPSVQLANLEYEEYLAAIRNRPIGPAPVLYDALLHGKQER